MGASAPEELGLYYAWGDVNGHSINDGYSFSEENYNNSDAHAINSDLTAENDAATITLGELCKIPSNEDYNELISNTDNIWTTLNGVKGRLFTSRINGQVLFIPAAGYFNDTNNPYIGKQAHLWSSIYINQINTNQFKFNETTVEGTTSATRRYGFSIRPVKVSEPNRSIIPTTSEVEPYEEETTAEEETKENNER